jgi:hypothetical protein
LLTASAHLRSSGRQGSANADELIAFGLEKDWQEAIMDYAIDYAHQVNKDHKLYLDAHNKGYFGYI